MKMAIDQIIEIIYIDKKNQITKRKIEITDIRDTYIRAHCLTAGGPRVFLLSNILAWNPVSEKRYA